VNKSRKLAILIIVLVAFFFAAGVFAVEKGPRYFVKSKSVFWQKSLGARHVFDNGFSVDLSGFELTFIKLFGLEIEPIDQVHILPEEPVEESGVKASDNEKAAVDVVNQELNDLDLQLNSKGKGKGALKKERLVPSDQTPWGIEVVYNDYFIASTYGGEGVNVAVLDTGVSKDHPDLQNRVSQCKDFTHKRFPIRDRVCDDKNGHGTHVAGIILADAGLDGLGIYGVAPQANLFSYKVCGNDGSCWADDVAMGIRMAVDQGAHIINLSIGSDQQSALIADAIAYAVSKDALVVAAAGNDGPYFESIDYPAANENVVAVGAVDASISVPDWSSRGINSTTTSYLVEEKDLEFGAPGVNIESTWKNGGYVILSGTSMSAPFVSGLAAKFWRFDVPEGERALATREYLHQLAVDIWLLGDDDSTGFGLPQVYVPVVSGSYSAF